MTSSLTVFASSVSSPTRTEQKCFRAVRSRLEPQGYYLIGTAIFAEERDYGDQVVDKETG